MATPGHMEQGAPSQRRKLKLDFAQRTVETTPANQALAMLVDTALEAPPVLTQPAQSGLWFSQHEDRIALEIAIEQSRARSPEPPPPANTQDISMIPHRTSSVSARARIGRLRRIPTGVIPAMALPQPTDLLDDFPDFWSTSISWSPPNDPNLWVRQLAVGAKVDLHVKYPDVNQSEWIGATVVTHDQAASHLQLRFECSRLIGPPLSAQRSHDRVNEKYWATNKASGMAEVAYSVRRGTASRQTARDNPSELLRKMGKLVCRVNEGVTGGHKRRADLEGQLVWVAGYIAELGKHLLMLEDPALSRTVTRSLMVDLTSDDVIFEPFDGQLTVSVHAIAQSGTRTFSCQICDEVHCKPDAPAYPIHRRPRRPLTLSCSHPVSCCDKCMKRWADTQLADGRLFVPCPEPSCARNLTVAEIRHFSGSQKADRLAAAIKDTEIAASADRLNDVGYEEWATKSEAKHCPKCHVAIEKNQGCNRMTCYRCGHEFDWLSDAARVSGKPIASKQVGAKRKRNVDDPCCLVPLCMHLRWLQLQLRC